MAHKRTSSSADSVNNFSRSNIAGTQVSKFSFPSKEDGISDHIKDHAKAHKTGRFLGAAIADIETISEEEMAQSMRNLAATSSDSTTVILPEARLKLIKPVTKYNFAAEIERLALGKEHGEMNLKNKLFDSKYDYLCVRKLVGYFVPLASSTTDKFEVVVLLKNKNNEESNQLVCQVKFDSPIACSFFMSMDYYINFGDLKSLSLEVHCNQNIIRPGTQWAAMKLSMTCKQSSFPKPLNIFPTQVQIYPPYSLLFQRNRDPKTFNARITQEDLEPLTQMYLDNQVVYVKETLDQRRGREKSRYAGTRFAGMKDTKSSEIGSDSGGPLDEPSKEMLDQRSGNVERMRQEGLRKQREQSRLVNPTSIMNQKPQKKPIKVTFDSNTNFAEALKYRLPLTPNVLKIFDEYKEDPDYSLLTLGPSGDHTFSVWQDKEGNKIKLSHVIPEEPRQVTETPFANEEVDDKGMPSIPETKEDASEKSTLSYTDHEEVLSDTNQFSDIERLNKKENSTHVTFHNNEDDRDE